KAGHWHQLLGLSLSPPCLSLTGFLHEPMLRYPWCLLAMVFFRFPTHRRGARNRGPLSSFHAVFPWDLIFLRWSSSSFLSCLMRSPFTICIGATDQFSVS